MSETLLWIGITLMSLGMMGITLTMLLYFGKRTRNRR